MILFAARETLIAGWLIAAATCMSNEACRFLAFSVAFTIIPCQVWTLLKHKHIFRDEAYITSMILQFVMFSYLWLSAYTFAVESNVCQMYEYLYLFVYLSVSILLISKFAATECLQLLVNDATKI